MSKFAILSADKTAILGTAAGTTEALRLARQHGVPRNPDHIMPHGAALEIVMQNNKPAPTTSFTGNGGVSAVAVARQDKFDEAQRQAFAKLGHEFTPTAPVFERGTRVDPTIGAANFSKEGARINALPGREAMLAAADVIDAEKRMQFSVRLPELEAVADNGRLLLRRRGKRADGRANPARPVSTEFVRALVRNHPAFDVVGPALYTPAGLGGLDVSDKAAQLNKFLQDRVAPSLDLAKRTVKQGGLVSIHTRRTAADDGWELYHVSSKRHTSHHLNGAQFLRAAARAMPDDLKYEVTYDRNTTDVQFNAWAMPNHVVDLSAGDVFKGGISGGTSDIGGSYWGGLQFIRNLCLNLIILADERAEAFRVSHNANPTTVLRKMRQGIADSDAAFDLIREQWGMLREVEVEDPKAVLAELAKVIGLPRRSAAERDASVEMLLNGWAAEPGNTKADLLNAVSRLHLQRDLDSFEVARQSGKAMAWLLA